jgi:hypothetical protein
VGRTNDNIVLGFADGAIVLESVRPEGSSTMPALAWWAGRRYNDQSLEWS